MEPEIRSTSTDEVRRVFLVFLDYVNKSLAVQTASRISTMIGMKSTAAMLDEIKSGTAAEVSVPG